MWMLAEVRLTSWQDVAAIALVVILSLGTAWIWNRKGK